MKTKLIKDLLSSSPEGQLVTVKGWVRTKRASKNLVFLDLSDGSCLNGLQLTFDRTAGLSADTEEALKSVSTGASVEVMGQLTASPGQGQRLEVAATSLRLVGPAPTESYPLQKKSHSLEFLREIGHLRPRTNTFGAVARIRNRLAFATHEFFQSRGFLYIHTPIITSNDCEGAGAMFQVTTLDLAALAKNGHKLDYSKDFFGKPTYLTVSGQLEAESYALALSRVYTFGPTFRAENSNTTRHLAEFWMIEPEMAFALLADNMVLAEEYIKELLSSVFSSNADDLAFFNDRIQPGLLDNLEKVKNSEFVRLSYTEAIKELEKAKVKFEFKPYWGCDLQTEHEKYLSEQLIAGPVIVYDYPKEIKAFYMKLNADGRTVRAMDVLVPRLGEIIGGSEREDDLQSLEQRLAEQGLQPDDYWWYLDLRRFGSVPHSGFGLGFERLIQYVTGMNNIRDVIPFPRAVGQADF